MLRRTIFAFTVVLWCSTSTVQAQTTALFFDSQPGDYIGQGLTQTWTSAELTFSATSSTPSSIVVSANGFPTAPTPWTL
jgi:hypothetical protein